MPAITRLDSTQDDFRARLDALLAWESVSDAAVFKTVNEILNAVRTHGDAAVLEYTKKFDRLDAAAMSELEMSAGRLQQALAGIPAEQRNALETAAQRVRQYHDKQRMESWSYTEADGTLLGQQVTALDRAGLYVPGGKAAYPSSVLMNAIPAQVAGGRSRARCTPAPGGQLNPYVLVAADLLGIGEIYRVGGAPFNDFSVSHDKHLVGDLGHDAKIMGDEYHCHVTFFPQVEDQLEDLHLRCHIERRCRFVGDQNLRFQSQSHCDHRPLTLPSGKLERVGADDFFRVG